LIEVLLRYYYVGIEEEGSMYVLMGIAVGLIVLGIAARDIQKKL